MTNLESRLPSLLLLSQKRADPSAGWTERPRRGNTVLPPDTTLLKYTMKVTSLPPPGNRIPLLAKAWPDLKRFWEQWTYNTLSWALWSWPKGTNDCMNRHHRFFPVQKSQYNRHRKNEKIESHRHWGRH